MRESPTAQPPGPRGPLTLLAASVLLAAVGAGLTIRAAQLRDGPAANGALTDAAATSQVTVAVSAGVSEIYSYTYTDLAATRQAARRVLAGQAAAQYDQLSPELSDAVAERLTVVTRVRRIGVSSLTSGSARLLVFLEQAVTRDGRPAGSVPAQLEITARLTGGRWLITGIDAR
jgi:Mce-associated membrane protein